MTPGRVAVVFPFPLERGHLGKDLLLIPEGLRALGAEVELHCPRAEPAVEWPVPVIEAGDRLGDASHYRGRGLDAALVFSFLHFPRLLAAVRDAGLHVVAKGDTTGESVVRAHPGPMLRHARYDEPTRAGRARALAAWAARLGPLAGRDGRELQRVLGLAATTVVETQVARENVERSLRTVGAGDLAARLEVVPNPVMPAFTTTPVPAERERLVVAVGRWDLAAKDAPLLAAALERFLRRRPDHQAIVVGAGGDGVFGGAVRREAPLPQPALATLLARARVIVTSSHWESFSLSTHEGLAMGCSAVGPAIVPIRNAVAAGPYGTVAARRTPRALAEALEAEAHAWDAGRRDAVASAAWWRRRLDLDSVAARYSALLDVSGSDA